MEPDIKAAIASAKSQNRPLSDAEMQYFTSYLEQRSVQLEAAAYLSENTPHLSKATALDILRR